MDMDLVFRNILFLLARYLHIVCATTLVGGTLFYEMVVPIAIEDLRKEQQLAIMGRARWVFRWIVWISAVLIIVSGAVSAARHWDIYEADGAAVLRRADSAAEVRPTAALRPGWWFAAHAASGLMAVLVALTLTVGRRPPEHPVLWMRMNLVILLTVIFLATAARNVRLLVTEKAAQVGLRQINPP